MRRRNQLAALGKGGGKDPRIHCMTIVSSYYSSSRCPEEAKEQGKGGRELGGPPYFATSFSDSQHLLKFPVDIRIRMEEAKVSWSYTSYTVPASSLGFLHCFLHEHTTLSLSDPEPHLIQFQMLWKTLNPNNTGCKYHRLMNYHDQVTTNTCLLMHLEHTKNLGAYKGCINRKF